MALRQRDCTLEEIADILKERNDFVLCGHVNPDGDCIGSQMALQRALQQMGKRVCSVWAKGPCTDDGLRIIPGIGGIVSASSFDGTCATFISLDVDMGKRIGEALQLAEQAELRITIDHHSTSAGAADIRFNNADAAANCMNVWRLVQLLLPACDEEIATACYVGLMTDTGRFQFQNVDAACFNMASEMIACGANPSRIAASVYQSRSVASLALEALMLQHAEIDEELGFAMSWLSADDFTRVHAIPSDTETFVDILRSVRAARVACLLREQDGAVRGSLRAKDDTDVAAIARQFGGGGHKAAAGLTIEDMPISQAVSRVRAAIIASLQCSAPDC